MGDADRMPPQPPDDELPTEGDMTPRYAVILEHDTFAGMHTVRIRCPYCGRTHTHGLPDDSTSMDSRHRLSHCAVKHPDDHGYYLVEATEVSNP